MKRALGLALTAFLLTACGGGGGHSVLPAPTSTIGAPVPVAGSGNTKVAISIPAPSKSVTAGLRRALYISSATNSISIAPAGQAANIVPLTPTSPGCVANSDGSRTCTVNFSLPAAANEIFTVSAFASANGTGTPLSTVTITQTIVANQANAVNLTLGGVVDSVSVALSPNTGFTLGQAETRPIVVNVLDAAGQTIVIPVNSLVDSTGAAATIGVTDSDTSGATKIVDAAHPSGYAANTKVPITDTSGTSPQGTTALSLAFSGTSPTGGSNLTANVSNSVSAFKSANLALVATALTRSIYALDAGTNTISEFVLPLTSTSTPKRVFGGTTAGCPSVYDDNADSVSAGLSGLTIDQSGSVYTYAPSNSNNTSVGCPTDATIYRYSPAATGSAIAANVIPVRPLDSSNSAAILGYDFNAGTLDVNNGEFANVNNPFPYNAGFLDKLSLSGNSFAVKTIFGFQDNSLDQSDICFLAPSATDCSSANGDVFAAVGFGLGSPTYDTFTVDQTTGNVYYGGASLINPSTTAGQIIQVPPALGNIPSVRVGAAWIEGPNTLLDTTVAMALDGTTLYALNVPYYSVIVNGNAGRPPSRAPDGSLHAYITAYDTTKLSGKVGAQNLRPIVTISGSKLPFWYSALITNYNPFFGDPFAGSPGYFGGMVVANGSIYLGNPLGPCDTTCQTGLGAGTLPLSSIHGEIDVFAAISSTNAIPTAVINGAGAPANPVALVMGLQGTGVGTQGLHRAAATVSRGAPRRVSESQSRRLKYLRDHLNEIKAARKLSGYDL